MGAIEIAIIIGMFLSWGAVVFGLLHMTISDMADRRRERKKKEKKEIDVYDIEFKEITCEDKDDKETIDEDEDDKEESSTYPYILLILFLITIIIIP